MNDSANDHSDSLAVEAVAVANQQTHADGSVFPFALECQGSGTISTATEWVSSNRQALLDQATRHGAVLLRGFPVECVEDFDSIIVSFGLANFPYKKSLSNAVRVNRTERVFSANEAPPEVQIFFHHEMAQTPLYPRWILFSCEVAAEQGGATPLCRSDILFERLQDECPQFAEDCEHRGLQYTNVMPAADDANSGMGRSWQSTLGVEDQPQAESRLRELGYSWKWDGDCLRATTPALPAVVEVSPGRKVFFNQLIAAFCGWKDDRNDPSRAIRHGDGKSLDTEAARAAVAIAEELAFDLAWQVGDVALVDNMIAMHARRPFVGKRKVVASLAEMQTQTFTPLSESLR